MEFNDKDMKWTIMKSRTIIDRPWLHATCDSVLLPSGAVYDEFYKLHYTPVVCMVAETTDGKIILERQYRHAVNEVLTEIPAGCVEEGEEPLVAAQRELLEETGYKGGEWTHLVTEYAQAGIQDNMMYGYYAKGVEPSGVQHLDEIEDINIYLVDKEEVLRMLMNNEIQQAPITSTLWKYFALHTDLLKK